MKHEFFISYCGSDGLQFAQELRSTLKNDFEVWLYEHHREFGESTWRDIAIHLMETDGVIVINTPGSIKSTGQERECGIALNNNKAVYVLKYDKSNVLPELSGLNHFSFNESNFSERFREFRGVLDRLTSRIREVAGARGIQTPQPIRKRQEILRSLRSNLQGLDSNKIKEYIQIIVDNYHSGTIVPAVASKILCDASTDLDLESFRQVNLYQTINKKEFLDPSYRWDYFFADIGRYLKRSEQKYLYEAILKQGGEPDTSFNRSKGDFSVIAEEAERLATKGFSPTVLLMPLNLRRSLIKFFTEDIDWAKNDTKLKLTNNIELKLIWSNKYAPLDEFLLISPLSGQWHSIPELGTKNELAIAIGNSVTDPEKEIAFFVDLIARYELVQRAAISVIHVVD